MAVRSCLRSFSYESYIGRSSWLTVNDHEAVSFGYDRAIEEQKDAQQVCAVGSPSVPEPLWMLNRVVPLQVSATSVSVLLPIHTQGSARSETYCMPCRPLKPSSGTRELPVTNCSNATRSWWLNDRTARQKYRTTGSEWV